MDHEKLYPCSPSTVDIATSCWSFGHKETVDESCIVQMEPCDDTEDLQDQSDSNNSSDQSDVGISKSCVEIMDSDIDRQTLKFYNGTPVICRDQISQGFNKNGLIYTMNHTL